MDATLKPRIIADLKQAIPTLPRGLRRAAKYVIDHPSDFGLDPIRETAAKAAVSTYTLVRLAETLGFARYDAMRAPFRQALVTSAGVVDRPGWIADLREAGGAGAVQAEAAETALAAVHRTLAGQDPARMARVVTLLTEAPAVYLTAVRASYALACLLHYVGRMALPGLHLIPRHMTSAIDELHMARPGDVLLAITFTPCSRETIEACAFARRKGLKLVLISDSEILSPEFSADETLIAETPSSYRFGGYTGAMALIETLIAQLVARGGAAAETRIASFEALRNDAQAYWSPGKER